MLCLVRLIIYFYTFKMSIDQGHWEVLIDHEDYEINVEYPHQIRKIDNGRIVSESIRSGYVRVCLNRKSFQKHVLIAKQFVNNPDPDRYTVVDHINHIKTDNRIENLRWISQRMNSNNRSDQEFVNEISNEAIRVNSYNGYEFEELYFHDDVFYVYNGISYVIKPKYQNKAGYWYICIRDTTGVQRAISYIKFKNQYGLI